jgi:hypothetical protein
MLIRKGRNRLGSAGTLSIHDITAHPDVSSEKQNGQGNKCQDALPFRRTDRRQIFSVVVCEETSRKIDNATPGSVNDMNIELQGLLSQEQSKPPQGNDLCGLQRIPGLAREAPDIQCRLWVQRWCCKVGAAINAYKYWKA